MEFPLLPIPKRVDADIAEKDCDPSFDHSGGWMALAAPGCDDGELKGDVRIMNGQHLGESEGGAENVDPTVKGLA